MEQIHPQGSHFLRLEHYGCNLYRLTLFSPILGFDKIENAMGCIYVTASTVLSKKNIIDMYSSDTLILDDMLDLKNTCQYRQKNIDINNYSLMFDFDVYDTEPKDISHTKLIDLFRSEAQKIRA